MDRWHLSLCPAGFDPELNTNASGISLSSCSFTSGYDPEDFFFSPTLFLKQEHIGRFGLLCIFLVQEENFPLEKQK